VTSIKHGKGQYIDYSKCDAFACGMVAHNMLSAATVEPFSVGSSKDYAAANYNPLPEGCASPAMCELVASMVHPDAAARLSLVDAEFQLEELLAAGFP
jgi:hypothetical protein